MPASQHRRHDLPRPAVLHDRDTKPVAGVDRRIIDCTLAELRRLDVGRWKGDQFAGEKILTPAEMLAAVPPGKRVSIEVKTGPAWPSSQAFVGSAPGPA